MEETGHSPFFEKPDAFMGRFTRRPEQEGDAAREERPFDGVRIGGIGGRYEDAVLHPAKDARVAIETLAVGLPHRTAATQIVDEVWVVARDPITRVGVLARRGERPGLGCNRAAQSGDGAPRGPRSPPLGGGLGGIWKKE